MKERLGLVLLAALSLTACNEQQNNNDSNANSSASASYSGRSYGVFGKLRPQADAGTINQIHSEEEAARKAREDEQARELKAQQDAQKKNDPNQRSLPNVANSSFSGNLPTVNGGAGQISGMTADQQKQMAAFQQNIANANGQPGGNNTINVTGSWSQPPMSTPPPPPAAASYGVNYTTPSPGFVPPPPAVSLSTQATPMFGGPPPPAYYGNPYAAYGVPPGGEPAAPQRAPGSGFGAVTTGASKATSKDDDDDAPRKKKEKPMQIITPTGMEARSPYKQRDELRMLWKGALASSLSGVSQDSKFADGLAKIDVGLPGESSKGSLSIAQRQVDGIFKNTGAVDKKVFGTVKKTQTDLVQAYYRYLYAYNKFFLTQQQVQARKQELDCADSQSDKQRATVDLANSQQEADASRDDMRSAQNDLASVAGAAAARTVIKNVSGVTPQLDQTAQADSAQAKEKGGEGGLGGIFNVFGFGKGKSKNDSDQAADDTQKVAAAPESKGKEKKEKEKDKDKDVKEKKKGKGDKEEKASKDKDGKKQIAAKPAEPAAPSSKAESNELASTLAPSSPAASSPASSAGPVSFELKDVKTTPRKSVLRVVVKNSGGDNFSFDADSISVAEGNNKLADASVSSEFDSTIVQPSQEVTGTITIFGRPWNDKLTVSLSNGNRPIFLHR